MAVALLALGISLSTGAYAAVQIPRNSVGAAQLKNRAVTAKKIEESAVTAPKIKPGAVNGAKLAAKSITESKMAADSVPAAALQDSSVSTAKLDAGSVKGEKIERGAITKEKIAADSVDSDNIIAGAITSGLLAPRAVNTQNLADLPAARILMSGATPVANNTIVGLGYSSLMFDTRNLFDAAEPGYLRAPVSGIYEFDINATFAANGTGNRVLRVWHWRASDGGAKVIGGQEIAALSSGPTPLNATGTVQMGAGDELQPYVIQTSGGALNMINSTENVPGFSLSYVAPPPVP
ncbi:MAG TPA: hypothetical protein VMF31_12870 [Solirubrobacterales bacterium]|nr:hypothetical protein [Solirubrobacterales bacterium]